MGTPLPNGVYDPRLGPTTTDSPPCPTCAQRYLGCPGHFGHIELCVPLYQPLLFQKMLDLLKMKCFNCHKLNVTPRTIKVFKTKFELLQHGEYSRAKELDSLMSAAVKEHIVEGKKKDSLQAAGAAVDKLLSEITVSLKPDTMVPKYSRSAYEEEFHRELAKEFIAACKLSKCCPYCGAHSPKIRHDSFNKVFQSPLSATARRLNEAEGIKLEPALSKIDAGGGKGNGGDAGYDSDDTHREETMMETPNDLSPQDSGRDKYMHPSEVQAQIRRTWETSPELCAAVFAVQGCEIFFMQAIPVPPNRFRPPMHLGGMVVEHAQNGFLNKLILSNESVRSSFVQKKEGLAYKHWIQLQTFLNCLLDSAKDPSINADQVPGIRQLLERKEGIFRKHMMGKRVNYACRSVISPDPYIGTNEIGIPRHFAVTLTYPTPVTDINIEEMRNLVERGPSQWPGARWVEFPDRRVDLSKMDNHQREAVAARLLMYAKKGGRPAIVGRQMRDGDMVLMNRQVRCCTWAPLPVFQ